MSDYLSAEIAATCAALGYFDGSKYHLEKDCVGEYFLLSIIQSRVPNGDPFFFRDVERLDTILKER